MPVGLYSYVVVDNSITADFSLSVQLPVKVIYIATALECPPVGIIGSLYPTAGSGEEKIAMALLPEVYETG